MSQSNGKTVWEHEEKKWKPRTFQAAKVFFPAHDIHRPPEEVKEPVFVEPPKPLTQEQLKFASSQIHAAGKSASGRGRQRPRHKPKKKKLSMQKIISRQAKAIERMRERIAAGKTPLPSWR